MAVTQTIEKDLDVYQAHRAVRDLARELAFSRLALVQIASAVSEIARNALIHGNGGGINARKTNRGLSIEIWDKGPGISMDTLVQIEDGSYQSQKGLGKGISGSRKLMDRLEILTNGVGTQVFMEKHLKQ